MSATHFDGHISEDRIQLIESTVSSLTVKVATMETKMDTGIWVLKAILVSILGLGITGVGTLIFVAVKFFATKGLI